MNLTKKKIQFHFEQKSNDTINIPFINIQKFENLIDSCLNKNKFSGISSKIELVNEIINFMIYILTKFGNFQNNQQELVPNEFHLLNPSSKKIFENILNVIFLIEKEIKEELDNLNVKKNEISDDLKKNKEDKGKELEALEIKSNHLLILIDNMKKLQEIKK